MSSLPLVLIVDDVPENITVLGTTLAQTCRIRFATSGQEGLDLVANERPDLILLDVMMPGMNGYQVLDRLKSGPDHGSTPVIFVTAKTDADSETRALLAGAVDFIHKPINPDVVRARVKMHLELAQYRRDLERNILERTQELATARMEAESAQAVVTRFMKNLSHEMRTPLNGIVGLSDILQKKLVAADFSRLDHFVGMLQKSAQRMKQLVETMLQIAEQHYSEMTGIDRDALDWIDLAQLMSACFLTHEKIARQRDQQLCLECDLPHPEIQCDPVRVRQVFDALIGNALRYSPASTTVRVRIGKDAGQPDRFAIQVIDQGCGIPEPETGAIFEPFYESSRTCSGAGGTGLGLPLCKAIVKRHQGSLSVSNRPEGGAVFQVVLPVTQTHPD